MQSPRNSSRIPTVAATVSAVKYLMAKNTAAEDRKAAHASPSGENENKIATSGQSGHTLKKKEESKWIIAHSLTLCFDRKQISCA